MSLTVVYILVAILLFGLLVLVHEFGHFLTAKLSGVQVNEFSLFMGPAIWKRQKGETLYSLRCIPIGGYCAMEGEDGDSDNPRAFGRAKVWKRLIILVAGSFMNLVAGLLIMTIYVASVYQAIPTRAVASVDSASVFAGQLQAGDSFYSIGGERVYTSGDVTMLLDRCEGGTADIVVLRGGEKVRLPNAQVERRDFGGEQLYGFTIDVQEKTLSGTLGFSWNSCVDFVRIVRLEGYERTGRHRRAGHGDGQPAGERLGGAGCRAVLLLLHRHQPRCNEPAAHPGAGRRPHRRPAAHDAHRAHHAQKAQPQI